MKKLLIALGIIIVLGVAWYLGSPLFLDKTVDESFPEYAADSEITGADSEPQIVAAGMFADGDSFHKGSGKATIYELPDGRHTIRFEDFEVTNGPDLHVYLASHPNPGSSETLRSAPYVDLGSLKGNRGSQNYEIPADVDVSDYSSIVIYCVPFHVIFSVASLQ